MAPEHICQPVPQVQHLAQPVPVAEGEAAALNPHHSPAQYQGKDCQQPQKHGPLSHGKGEEIDIHILGIKPKGEHIGKDIQIPQGAKNGGGGNQGKEEIFHCQPHAGDQPPQLHLLQKAQQEPQQHPQQEAAEHLHQEELPQKSPEGKLGCAFSEGRHRLHGAA